MRQDLFIKEQIKRRFVQTQNDCYLTILALLPVLTQPITDHLPIENITQALKMKKTQQQQSSSKEISDSLLTADNLLLHSNPNENSTESIYLNKSKVELWNDLKIKTLTRTLTLIYSISALLLITRLQLNILARRSYLESAITMAGGKVNNSSANEASDYFTEQSYLSLSWWLLNKGWLRISEFIEAIILSKFQAINAKTEITIFKFNEILDEINQEILTNHQQELVNLIFPIHYDNLIDTLLNTNPELIDQLDVKDSNFIKLINETNLLVTNDFFVEIYSKMVLSSTDTLINNLFLSLDADTYLLYNSLHQESEKIVELNDLPSSAKKFKLANLLAQLSIQCGVICDNNNLADYDNAELSGNVYINTINELEELDEFSASIYSNFE